MLPATKTNIIIIIIIIISSSSLLSSLSRTAATITTALELQTTHMGLKIDAHKNIDGQNNSVTKKLMDSTLIIEIVWDQAQQRLEKNKHETLLTSIYVPEVLSQN